MEIELDWFGEKISDDIEETIDQVLVECALYLKDESQKQVPIDKGNLQNNCSVTLQGKVAYPAKIGPSLPTLNIKHAVDVGYTLPYAARVHEDLGCKHPSGGKAKFLEDAFSKDSDKYTQMIIDAVDEVTT
jgi:hypothetical protein